MSKQVQRRVRQICMSVQLTWRASCVSQMTSSLGSGSCKLGIKVFELTITNDIRSLHSTKSLDPLEISESLMRKILTRYKVDPTFLSVLYSFGGAPHLAENGSSNVSSRITEDGSHSKANAYLVEFSLTKCKI